MKLTELSDDAEPLRVLWWGGYGTGKTTDLAAMARRGKVLYIAKEPGLKRKPLERLGIPINQIRVARPESYKDLESVFWNLTKAKKLPFGVAWDSVTAEQGATLTEIIEEGVAKAKRSNQTKDPFHASQDQRTRNNEMIRRILRRFCSLPIHLAISALDRRDEDEDTGDVHYGPGVTPGIQNDVGGWMDIVLETVVVEVDGEAQYRGLSRPDGRHARKDRFGVLPPVMIDPTFDRVLDYVEGRLERETDPLQQAAREAKARGKKATPKRRKK